MSSRVLWSWVSLHFLSGFTQFLADLLQGSVPVWLIIMQSTSWNRFFSCFEDCRGILVDTVLGEGGRLCVDVSEFPDVLPVGFLVVPTGRQFSCTGKGQDYRFVVTASKLCLARVKMTGLWSLPPSCAWQGSR